MDRSDEDTDSENDTDNEDFDKDQLLLVHRPYLKYSFFFKYALALKAFIIQHCLIVPDHKCWLER